MNLIKKAISYFFCTAFLFSCSQKNTENKAATGETKPVKEPTIIQASPTKPVSTPAANTITAKFTGFELGDVSHFSFTEASGKEWDFTDCEEKKYEFSKELPKEKTNETNQGYGANESLLHKTFEINFEKRDGKKLTNGLMDSVLVIVKAEQKD
jgi:hypothetical protein